MRINRCIAIIVLITILTPAALATVIPRTDYFTTVPVDRIIKNTTAYIEQNPQDAHGYYTLARIHYFAFINKSFRIGGHESNKLPEIYNISDVKETLIKDHAREIILKEKGFKSGKAIPAEHKQSIRKAINQKIKELKEQNWQPPSLTNKQIIEHAQLALKNFTLAIEKNGKAALYHISLGSFVEQYVDFHKGIDSEVIPNELCKITLVQAKEAYYKAHILAIDSDLKRKYPPYYSQGAGYDYLRLAKKSDPISENEKTRIEEVNKNIEKIHKILKREEKKRNFANRIDRFKRRKGIVNKFKGLFGNEPRVVTPIIFSLKDRCTLSDLLAENTMVEFDLDGDDLVEEWPWVKPDTGILVWDPEGKGKITSGRQLFGSVTWWMFFEDGYHAMDALDDSRDGQLTGDELAGISVWFDTNTNGISEPGEVTPIGELSIAALSTKSDGTENNCPKSSKGLSLKNGQQLPTYDWIATSDQSN